MEPALIKPSTLVSPFACIRVTQEVATALRTSQSAGRFRSTARSALAGPGWSESQPFGGGRRPREATCGNGAQGDSRSTAVRHSSRARSAPSRNRETSKEGELKQQKPIASRKNPRARMGRGRRRLWWDTLDTLYFVGYALSNYVRAPFLFAQNGFHVVSAGVATLASGTWSTLRVTFPVDEPTHCPTQVCYLDAAHLIRRLDYVAEPIGRWARAAHFCADYSESRGLRAPTRRWVVPRTRDDRVVSWPPLVQFVSRPFDRSDGSSHTPGGEAPRSS